jgi:hypothetical protein
MLGAIRLEGWMRMSTLVGSANGDRFVNWIRRGLAPKLRRRNVVILDNAPLQPRGPAAPPSPETAGRRFG